MCERRERNNWIARSSYQKSGWLTLFFVGLILAGTIGESLFPGRFFGTRELLIAIGVCWTSDILSIVCVDAARRQSGNGIAGVWIGTAPRLGGPMLAAAVLVIAGGQDRTIACLVLVYLVSLPLTVYLTLPEVNRKIKKPAEIKNDSEGGDP